MASFCKVDSAACRLPSMLGTLEEHDFLFRLHLNNMPQDESNEVRWASVDSGALLLLRCRLVTCGRMRDLRDLRPCAQGMEVPLVAVLQWSTPKMPFTDCIYTHYRYERRHLLAKARRHVSGGGGGGGKRVRNRRA